MQWLSLREAAARSGVHHTTLYRKAKKGKIRFKTIKEFLRIAWDEK